ncbi:AGAP008235-PA, partial [Anopheles gambiae str. PEST]
CDQCERTFPTKKQRTKHQYHHKTTECPICGKEIKRKYLKSHIAAHEDAFRCEICMTSYSRIHELRRHKAAKHFIHDTFACAECNRSFPNGKMLIAHRQKMHRTKCTLCDQMIGRTFASKKQRNDHRYHHTQTQCPICAKQIKRKYLASHVAAHEGTFCCEICMRTYSTRNHLRRHNAVKHYIRTTFPCALCKCSFPNASALIIHRQKMHRIQKCSGCNKMIGPAKMKDCLAAHEGAHRCGMCGRTFASKKGLKRHTQKAIP